MADTMQGFTARHIGPRLRDQAEMLKFLNLKSLEELTEQTVPNSIRHKKNLDLMPTLEEHEVLEELRQLSESNKVYKSYIGQGYYGTYTPPVILRNILENPGWYTQYTPYQAEISQGRLEALLNFQTMVMEMTGFDLANASLLDEATAAAEAMTFSQRVSKSKGQKYFVDENCHPQTLAVVQTRAEPLGIEVVMGSPIKFEPNESYFGVLIQYPNTHGEVTDYSQLTEKCQGDNVIVSVATDLLALTHLKPPGEWGADVAIGSAQRFGVPMGYGGPHAAFIATKQEYKRQIPGRLVGVSKDKNDQQALRLALQTREQHIRREKASSNICTAQVLLAIMASMYAVYHGPEELKRIGKKVHQLTGRLKASLEKQGYQILNKNFFDTLTVQTGDKTQEIYQKALDQKINLANTKNKMLSISLDETSTEKDLLALAQCFGAKLEQEPLSISSHFLRTSPFLQQAVFNTYRSETEMLRYIRRLQEKDLSLTHSMIPLGSCTMKLNAAMEMLPITYPGFSQLHPFAPVAQTQGYQKLFSQLEALLSEITGFAGISLQPNAGSQGEYAGLLVIREYHKSRGEPHRHICLIPQSAHGTNPASAVMAGMKVIVVQCDEMGNINLSDLEAKATEHSQNLAALMVTYPSTHGVFEEEIRKICDVVHHHGGQVYMDGANMNAQVALCRPADYGADVLHLNLHKTFCIPHGGGGPGMGPIGVQKHLAPFLPSHPLISMGGERSFGTISAAPWGSANILPISWAYIRAMGAEGLKQATEVAILNANYIAKKLDPHFPVLYKGRNHFVAHECIVDLRELKAQSGIEVEDVAKRLMDYGFHAPTISFPVIGTLMIEPTESESLEELNRFCDALIAIRQEIQEVINGEVDRENNLLKNSPHTMSMVVSDQWDLAYSRERAAFPLPYVRARKFWPSVARIDNAYGDRNLFCSCGVLEA